MRVLHIIPAAFDYYDDIKDDAFAEIEAEASLGIEVEACTMQYQAPSRPEQGGEVGVGVTKSPTRRYQGTAKLSDIENEINDFDALHVHVPILGGLAKVVKWKKANPKLSLVVTIHRESKTPDFFSLILLVYNRIILPRVLRAADFIAYPDVNMIKSFYRGLVNSYEDKLVAVDQSSDFTGSELAELSPATRSFDPLSRLAFKYIILYNEGVKN